MRHPSRKVVSILLPFLLFTCLLLELLLLPFGNISPSHFYLDKNNHDGRHYYGRRNSEEVSSSQFIQNNTPADDYIITTTTSYNTTIASRLLAACVCVDGMYYEKPKKGKQYQNHHHHDDLYDHNIYNRNNNYRNSNYNLKIKSSYVKYCIAAGVDTNGMLEGQEPVDVPPSSSSSSSFQSPNTRPTTNTATLLEHGLANENGVLIYRNQDGIIISFRGTLPLPSSKNPHNLQSTLDWLHDFKTDMITPSTSNSRYQSKSYIQGSVHSGIYSSLISLWTRGNYESLYYRTKSNNDIHYHDDNKFQLSDFRRYGVRIKEFLHNLVKRQYIQHDRHDTSWKRKYEADVIQKGSYSYLKDELKRQIYSIMHEYISAFTNKNIHSSSTSNSNKTIDDEIMKINHNNNRISPIKIYVTGHSKGGAMASIAALMILNEVLIPMFHNDTILPYNYQNYFNLKEVVSSSPIVYTFGSVKPGNAIYKSHYEKYITQFSFENYLDPVSFYPLDEMEYKYFKKLMDTNLINFSSSSLGLLTSGDDPDSIGKSLSVTKKQLFYMNWLVKYLGKVQGDYKMVGHRICIIDDLISNNNKVLIEYETEKSSSIRYIDSNSRRRGWERRWIIHHARSSIHIGDVRLKSSIQINNLDRRRISEITLGIIRGEDLLAHHKPSCRFDGYMHGLNETFCSSS